MSILHGEPGYKIRSFVREMLGRCKLVINDMGSEFESLLREMIRQLEMYRDEKSLEGLGAIRFEQIRWTNDGHVRIAFSHSGAPMHPDDEPRLRHEIIDSFVDDVLGRTVPDEARDQFGYFVRGMVMQFQTLKQNQGQIDLRDFTLGDVHWVGTEMVIAVKLKGTPFVPGRMRLE